MQTVLAKNTTLLRSTTWRRGLSPALQLRNALHPIQTRWGSVLSQRPGSDQ